ncbi:MAG: hypothetical protein HXX14_14660 [Bacteroidetes bacterium]|nr:hypothetical protein [Bacteroidota bacterium]
MDEQLKITLGQVIAEFSNNRAKILQSAFNNGGEAEVDKLEQEYDVLRDAYFEILKRQLDKNNHLYEQLTSSAIAETDRLKDSVQQMNNINEIISLTTSVINLVGRVILVLGV